MERRFSIEAKTFNLSVKEGLSIFCLEERMKGFVRVILVGHRYAA